jgi:hypothetical protein
MIKERPHLLAHMEPMLVVECLSGFVTRLHHFKEA